MQETERQTTIGRNKKSSNQSWFQEKVINDKNYSLVLENIN